jgi:hypothetical protein
MPSTTAPHTPRLRLALGAICALCCSAFAQTVLWSEMGGGFGTAPQHVGIVGQESSAGEASGLDAGFLAHPLFLNSAPLAQDTSVQAAAESLSVVVPGEDVDGVVVSGRVVVPPAHGTASFSGVVLAYEQTSGYVGDDSVGFVVVDDQGAVSDTAWVRIQVAATTALAPRPVLVAPVKTTDVRVFRAMASASAVVPGGGLVLSGGADDDGSGVAVSVLLAGPSDVREQIYDNLGTFVTSAESVVDAWTFSGLPSTGDGRRILSARWDLRDGGGRAVAPGVYLWKIVVVSNDGQKLETVRKTGVKQ